MWAMKLDAATSKGSNNCVPASGFVLPAGLGAKKEVVSPGEGMCLESAAMRTNVGLGKNGRERGKRGRRRCNHFLNLTSYTE